MMKRLLFNILVAFAPMLAMAQNSTKIVKASVIYSGKKSKDLPALKNRPIKDNEVFVYMGDHGKGYFKKMVDGTWGEFNLSTSEKIFSFTSVEETAFYKIIYDQSRKTYIKLTSDSCLWSYEVSAFNNKVHDGHWEESPY